MLQQLMEWAGYANQALFGQYAIVTLILAAAGGYGVGQVVKFPIKVGLAQWVPEIWADWIIRQCARLGSFAFGMWLGGVPAAIVAVVAFLQPDIYALLMKLLRKYAPWAAATPLGSASPTEDDQAALTVWRDKKP